MELLAPITQLASAFRGFVAPRYRPELHYMRGPGPACARRVRMLETPLQSPLPEKISATQRPDGGHFREERRAAAKVSPWGSERLPLNSFAE